MPETATFHDPSGDGPTIELARFTVPKGLEDRDLRIRKIPEPDPYYVDLGMLYRFAQIEQARRSGAPGLVPLHVAVRGHMGTGKDHDIEQFAAAMGLPYFRIPLTGEVRDVTLIGSTRLHGDGKGGTESRWEDGDITRALRGPSLLNLSELNAAGAETLFALHGLLDRYAALDLPHGETVTLRDDVRIFGTMNPTDLPRLCRHPDAEQGLRRPLGDLGEELSRKRAGRGDAHPPLSRAEDRVRGGDLQTGG